MIRANFNIFFVLLISAIIQNLFADDNKKISKEDLIKVDREFCKVSQEKGLDGWMSFFAEDSKIFPNNREIIFGKEEIRKYYESINFNPRILTWEPDYAKIANSGELGFTYGHAIFKIEDSLSTKLMKGKYVTIWKLQEDGNWKVLIDFGNQVGEIKN